MMRVSPEDLIVVYKNSSTKEPAYKIRLYDIDTEDTKRTTHYAEVYSPTKIEIFKSVDDGSCGATGKGKARQFASYEFVEEKSHIFGRIPIITVYNNEEQMSDLEKIETLVNDYDKVLSDVSNEFEAFRNAYLMLKNMVAGNDSIQKLKDEGIVEVMENGDMKFITKEIQTEALENHLNRLEKNIHKFSAVPDLSDENFAGNLSGVAIRFKLFGLETKCIIKERKMEKAIKELVRVLSVPIHVNTGREVDVLNLKVEFSRNVPNNLTEIVDTVTKLDGKVDKETLLSLLPFIDNPRGAENYEKWREAEAKKQEEVKIVEKVNTKTVEKELKENPTPVPEQIKLTDYPQVFYATKPEAKNTQALLDYMNSKTSVDPNVVALYTKMDKLCDGLSDEVVLKVTHGEHRVKRSWNRNFEYVFDVGIPKINPNYIGTYDTNLHEEMHFLDMLITVKDNKDKLPSKMFSQSYKPLVEAFDKATPVIGDKAKKLFEDFAKECDIIYKKQQETFNTQHEKIKEQYRSGAIDWKKYNSLFKKLQKEVNEEADNKRRALFGGGVSGLQDIYDAVSKGTFRDTGQVTYGHGSAYYTDRRRTNPNCSESLANYASLCVGHPELIDILAEDYPEIVTALRGCVEAMLKEVPK